MSKTIISTPNAPAAVGAYSQAIAIGNILHISGQIPINPQTNTLITSSFQDEVTQVMENIKAIVEEAGATMNNIYKMNVFLINMSDFQAFNEIYASYFSAPYPVRAAVAVKELPKGVSIEATAEAQLSNA